MIRSTRQVEESAETENGSQRQTEQAERSDPQLRALGRVTRDPREFEVAAFVDTIHRLVRRSGRCLERDAIVGAGTRQLDLGRLLEWMRFSHLADHVTHGAREQRALDQTQLAT